MEIIFPSHFCAPVTLSQTSDNLYLPEEKCYYFYGYPLDSKGDSVHVDDYFNQPTHERNNWLCHGKLPAYMLGYSNSDVHSVFRFNNVNYPVRYNEASQVIIPKKHSFYNESFQWVIVHNGYIIEYRAQFYYKNVRLYAITAYRCTPEKAKYEEWYGRYFWVDTYESVQLVDPLYIPYKVDPQEILEDSVKNELFTIWCNQAFSLIEHPDIYGTSWSPHDGYDYDFSRAVPVPIDWLPSPTSAFNFNEVNDIALKRSPVSPRRGFNNYDLNWLQQHAFLNACEGVPRLNENSIANIKEIFDIIVSLYTGEWIDSLYDLVDITGKSWESFSKYWLQYRYQYCTTKMDVQEAINYISRKIDLDHEYVDSYGIASKDGITMRCKIVLKNREVGMLKQLNRWLFTQGLSVNPYVLWDMLPYSFIADWFVPLGDVFSTISYADIINDEYYDFQYICYSLSYSAKTKDAYALPVDCYSRWYEDSSPNLDGMYWFEDNSSPSQKTVLKRCIDAASLILGKGA